MIVRRTTTFPPPPAPHRPLRPWRGIGTLLLTASIAVPLASCSSTGVPADAKAFCVVLDGATGTTRLTNLFAGDEVPTPAEVDDSAKVFRTLEELSPVAIKPELTAVVEFMDNDVHDLLKLVRESADPATADDAEAQLEPFYPKIEALDTHLEKIANFAKDRCGIDLDKTLSIE